MQASIAIDLRATPLRLLPENPPANSRICAHCGRRGEFSDPLSVRVQRASYHSDCYLEARYEIDPLEELGAEFAEQAAR